MSVTSIRARYAIAAAAAIVLAGGMLSRSLIAFNAQADSPQSGIVGSAAASSPVPATFASIGPEPIRTDAGPMAGAINSLVAHPTNPDIVWIGSVNGGVWKTTNATDAKPHWIPLTDHQASLSIGALALDPTSPSPAVLVAGIGHPSSFNARGGPLTGILRTTDGGDHWTPLGAADLSGQSITGVAPRGRAIIVSTNSGIWRSPDTGATFHHLGTERGLVMGPATGLAEDPIDLDILYTGITGPGGGVFRSDDRGVNWTNVSGAGFGQPTGRNFVSRALQIVLSVHHKGNTNVVYVGIIGPDKNPSGIFRSVDRGATWTALDIPPIEQAAQNRLSILADPDSRTLVYLGGDEPSADDNGPIYRCDASRPLGLQCQPISGGGTLDDSHPHADSRRMQFDAVGSLLEADDGGIFRNPAPRVFGVWQSINGDLSITESHSCVWDHQGQVGLCGTQDNGTVKQRAPDDTTWNQILGADGADVAAFNSALSSVKYYSAQHLGKFSREVCISTFCTKNKPSLLISGSQVSMRDVDLSLDRYKGPFPTPIATHLLHPNRLVIATGVAWESDDAGDTVTPLDGFFGLSTRAIAYGSNARNDVLYVGSSEGLFRHTRRFEPLTHLTAYPGGPPAGVALNPDRWRSAWVVDATSVFHTPDGGATWHEFTGDINAGGPADRKLETIALVPTPSGSLIFVGANDGLYVMSTAKPRQWSKLTGKLPNVLVYDLDFNAQDNVLLIATVGRGAWILANPGGIELP